MARLHPTVTVHVLTTPAVLNAQTASRHNPVTDAVAVAVMDAVRAVLPHAAAVRPHALPPPREAATAAVPAVAATEVAVVSAEEVVLAASAAADVVVEAVAAEDADRFPHIPYYIIKDK